MGNFPVRIAAADFLTPPELDQWRLAADGAGRVGGVRFSLSERARVTRLTDVYEQSPLRVFPLDLGPTEPTLAYLLNPTAGLMDGDAHLIEIDAGPATRTVVTGQSATRVHPCLRGFCTQQLKVTVAAGAVLVVLPGPTLPFAGCRLFQRINIDLEAGAHLVWGDLWFAGRYSRSADSERFRFERIVQEMLVRRAGRLVYRDRFCWNGPWNDETARWHFDGAPAVGMVFATGTIAENCCLAAEKTRMATFSTAAGDTCCRWTGSSDSVIRCVAQTSLRAAAALAGDRGGKPWLLEGNHLARTHWFEVA